MPTAFDLAPANVDDREAAETVLANRTNLSVVGDKGFLSREWQQDLARYRNIHLFTPKRKNQAGHNPRSFDQLVHHMLRWIDTVLDQLKGQFRLEQHQAKTLWGLSTRIIGKLTAYTFGIYLNILQGRKPLAMNGLCF